MSVWGDRSSFGSNNQRPDENSSSKLTCGPFGSKSNWSDLGSSSMLFMFSNNQTCQNNGLEPQSGHSSLIFKAESNQNGWNSSSTRSNGWNNSSSNQYNWNMSSSGGSSRNSSGPGSIDMSGTVEGVFRDEIRMMAEGNNSFHANNKF